MKLKFFQLLSILTLAISTDGHTQNCEMPGGSWNDHVPGETKGCTKIKVQYVSFSLQPISQWMCEQMGPELCFCAMSANCPKKWPETTGPLSHVYYRQKQTPIVTNSRGILTCVKGGVDCWTKEIVPSLRVSNL